MSSRWLRLEAGRLAECMIGVLVLPRPVLFGHVAHLAPLQAARIRHVKAGIARDGREEAREVVRAPRRGALALQRFGDVDNCSGVKRCRSEAPPASPCVAAGSPG